MTLATAGTNISEQADVEVTNVSRLGIWLLLRNTEYFLSYQDFPWFQNVSVKAIFNVELPSPNHLYWPDLDVDLDAQSISNLDLYPLLSKSSSEISDPKSISKIKESTHKGYVSASEIDKLFES